jgi:hypothetical protein
MINNNIGKKFKVFEQTIKRICKEIVCYNNIDHFIAILFINPKTHGGAIEIRSCYAGVYKKSIIDIKYDATKIANELLAQKEASKNLHFKKKSMRSIKSDLTRLKRTYPINAITKNPFNENR